MSFKWGIYRAALYVGVALSLAGFAGWAYYYYTIRSLVHPDGSMVFFFVALLVLAALSLWFLWILKKKFPDGVITDLVQGLTYLFAIFLFVASLYVLTISIVFLQVALKPRVQVVFMIEFSKYLCVETILVPVLYVYLGINGILLINLILKNRVTAFHTIAEIGRGG